MATTVQSIVDDVQLTLVDTSAARWTENELAAAASHAVRMIVNARPDLHITTGTLTLVAGTKQTLPTGAISLMDVTRNVGGRAIRRANMDLMDAQRPDWHTDTAGATRNYFYDPRTPLIFYVWPPASSGAQVEAKYPTAPSALALADNIPIGDEWVPLIREYVLYVAFSKDADFVSSAQRAEIHRQAWERGLASKATADAAEQPVEA